MSAVVEYRDILAKLERMAILSESNNRNTKRLRNEKYREKVIHCPLSKEDGNTIKDMLKNGYSIEDIYNKLPHCQKLYIQEYIKKNTDFVQTQDVMLSKSICMEILCLKHIGFKDEAIKWITNLDDNVYDKYINYFYLELTSTMKSRMITRGLENLKFLDTNISYSKIIDLIECLYFKMKFKDIRKILGLSRAALIECIELLNDYGIDGTELYTVNIHSVIPYIWDENDKRENIVKGFKKRVEKLHNMGFKKTKIAEHLDVDKDLVISLFTKNGKKLLR